VVSEDPGNPACSPTAASATACSNDNYARMQQTHYPACSRMQQPQDPPCSHRCTPPTYLPATTPAG